MFLPTLSLLVSIAPIWAINNNADLTWFDEDNHPQKYYARQPYPEGFNQTEKIVVNQKFPILWEVKFAFFDNLQDLVIDDCGINEIKPNTFKDLKPLTNLSLAFNNLKEVKEGVFNFLKVKYLDLGHNKIRMIAGKAFDNMPTLEEIVLDYNELKQWNSDWFFNCTKLGMVSFSTNFLEELPPKAFKNLWENRGDDFVNFYFGFNKIERIDRDAFEGTGNIGELFFNWNELHRVDGYTFGKIKSVEYLNMNGNYLKCFSDEFLGNVLPKIKLLSVLENPLKCDCLQELKKREGKLATKVAYSQTVDCSVDVQ